MLSNNGRGICPIKPDTGPFTKYNAVVHPQNDPNIFVSIAHRREGGSKLGRFFKDSLLIVLFVYSLVDIHTQRNQLANINSFSRSNNYLFIWVIMVKCQNYYCEIFIFISILLFVIY